MNTSSLHLQRCKKIVANTEDSCWPSHYENGQENHLQISEPYRAIQTNCGVPGRMRQVCMSENDLLQNQKDYHDEDQNDKDSGTHHHAPFLLGPLSLQNRRTKILFDCKLHVLMQPTIFSPFQETLLSSASTHGLHGTSNIMYIANSNNRMQRQRDRKGIRKCLRTAINSKLEGWFNIYCPSCGKCHILQTWK